MKNKTIVIEVKTAPVMKNPAMQQGIRDKTGAQTWGEKNGHATVYFWAKKQRVYAERLLTRVDAQAQEIEGASSRLLAKAVKCVSVTIPACEAHEGFIGNALTVRVLWVCPICGGKRGEPYDTISYDGSRRLGVTGWVNPCGHVDYYSKVRDEAKTNGLNNVSEVTA